MKARDANRCQMHYFSTFSRPNKIRCTGLKEAYQKDRNMSGTSSVVYKSALTSLDKELKADISIHIPEEKQKFIEITGRDETYWTSTVRIQFDDDIFSEDASGDNPLQALLMAMEFARITLHSKSDEWIDKNGSPDWVIFPHTVPISWGKEFYNKIVYHIKEKEREINKKIEHRNPPSKDA